MTHLLTVLLDTALPSMGTLPEYGIAAVVLYFWRQDRSDREKERDAQEARHSALASDFRAIVQENTAAIVALRDALGARHVFPFATSKTEQGAHPHAHAGAD